MPDSPPPRSDSGSGAKKAALIAAAVLVIAPITASQEGLVTRARPDPAHIPTYCYGETQNVDPERIYTKNECMALLRKRLARDYAPKVLACVPQLQERSEYVFAALIDASYNAGPIAVCKSPMAIRIRAGDFYGGCRAFVGWYTTARDRKTGVRKSLPGLVKRRRDVEAPLCLKGAALQPAAYTQPPAPPAVAQAPPTPPAPSLLERIGAFFRGLL